MSGSDLKMYNQMYNSIERPFADLDLTAMPWNVVMSIMEHQALEARRQISKFAQSEQLTPQSIVNFEFRQQANSNNSFNNSAEDNSDVSSCYSDEAMSDSPASSSACDSESDIEIDVDSVDDESDEEFLPSMDDIPITVLQLESKIREKDMGKRKWNAHQ